MTGVACWGVSASAHAGGSKESIPGCGSGVTASRGRTDGIIGEAAKADFGVAHLIETLTRFDPFSLLPLEWTVPFFSGSHYGASSLQHTLRQGGRLSAARR